MSIQQLSQFNRLKRLGFQQDDQDPAMSLAGIPPPNIQDDPYSVGNVDPNFIRNASLQNNDPEFMKDAPFEGDPSFARNDIEGLNKRVAAAPNGDPSDDWQRWFNDYKPEHAASDRLNNLIEHPPQREPTGVGRTLVAIGAGLGKGGVKAGQDIIDQPFERAKDEWTTQTGPAYQAASIERQSNANERQLRGTMAADEISTNKYLEQGRQANQRADVAREQIASKAEIEHRKMQILQDQNNKTTYEFKGEHVMANPHDGSEPYDTGIPTTAFSPYEIQILRNRGNMDVTVQQGTNAVTTKATDSGAGPKADNPRNERGDINNRFRAEWENGNNKYIERPKSPNDDWHMKTAPKDPAEYQKWNAVRMRVMPPEKGAGTPRPVPNLTGGGQPTAPTKPVDIKTKATQFLQQNKLPVTEANIQHAIQTGRVK